MTSSPIWFFQGDLGAIDDKYNVAVSTACSPLDHIVVSDIDSATKCIQHLKENNIGVSTFISLDKVSIIDSFKIWESHYSIILHKLLTW